MARVTRRTWAVVAVIWAGALVGSLLAYGGILLAGEGGTVVSEGVVLPSSHVSAVEHSRCELRHTKAHWWSERFTVDLVCGLPMQLPDAEPQRYVQRGMGRWPFWSAFVAQAAACVVQEWGYKHAADQLEDMRIAVPTQGWQRLRNCSIQVGPVIGLKLAAEHWQWKRVDADSAILPSTPWGAWATVKNVRDIQKVDALIRRVREANAAHGVVTR